MPKRSKVKLYEQIRKAREREGLSIHELSRRFGVHRRDVRQALESAVPASAQDAGAVCVAGDGPVEAAHRPVARGGS